MTRMLRTAFAMCVAAALAALALPIAPVLRAAGCAPGDRPLDGSCYAPSDRGKAGRTFLRVDGAEPLATEPRPAARALSNAFLSQEPFSGLDTFETTLIPFESLRRGPNPQKHGGVALNQLAIAFAQAVVHDLTKSRTTFGAPGPDFLYANDDPLCQLLAETSATTIYYFPCTASVSSANGMTTVSLSDSSRSTFVSGTTWTYVHGPFSITVPSNKFVQRRLTLPLVSVLGADDNGATQVPVNDVTSFLDLSIIYGNSSAVNALLRTGDGTGKLRVAPDGEIPFGGPGLPNDCGAFDPNSNPSSASGDSRVDDNLYLDFIHSLLFRNHNRDAEWVAANHPELTTDEQRFQRARAINIARFQRQVYTELLPALFGDDAVRRYVGAYSGYNAGVDPRISSSFDLAFRVAHAALMLPPYLHDENGTPVQVEGTLGFPSHARPNCLFQLFRTLGGRAVGRSAMSQYAQETTHGVSDLMRNIVLRAANNQNSAPFNLDIEQLNIIRGREFRTPNFNALRQFWQGESVYGLPGCRRAPEAEMDSRRCFKYVVKHGDTAERLRSVYRHVDRIDAFVGLMVEETEGPPVRFPPTATAIILSQFRNTRAADPWFYANAANSNLNFTSAEWARIRETVAESLDASYGAPNVGSAFDVHRFR